MSLATIGNKVRPALRDAPSLARLDLLLCLCVPVSGDDSFNLERAPVLVSFPSFQVTLTMLGDVRLSMVLRVPIPDIHTCCRYRHGVSSFLSVCAGCSETLVCYGRYKHGVSRSPMVRSHSTCHVMLTSSLHNATENYHKIQRLPWGQLESCLIGMRESCMTRSYAPTPPALQATFPPTNTGFVIYLPCHMHSFHI